MPIETKFIDSYCNESNLIVGSDPEEGIIFIYGKDLNAEDDQGHDVIANFNIWLDIPTAIKFCKTIRTEINKIKDKDDFERLSNTF